MGSRATALLLAAAGACGPCARPAETPSAQPAEPLSLSVAVDGAERVWTRAELDRIAPMEIDGDSGRRPAWPLRQLARELVGPAAAVTEVSGEGGASERIPDSAWRDPSRVPVLRLNKRGLLKFEWVSPAGAELGGGGVRGVTALRVRLRS